MVPTMLEKDPHKHISKFLSLVLRHQPEKIGITLDAQGWVDIGTLISAYNKHRKDTLTRELLNTVVETNNKKRFAIDGNKIRASQGHSVNVDLGYKEQVPPDTLYHGTVSKFLDPIYKEGLIKGTRHHVHLSVDKETAINVGSRRGKPIVLSIDAKSMYENGFKFFVSDNGVWLVDNVPTDYILIL